MGDFSQLLFYSFVGGVASLIGGVGLLIWKDKLMHHTTALTSFAAGVMLTVAVLDLIPEAFSDQGSDQAAVYILGGILFLFLLEKSTIWFHHHHEPHGRTPSVLGLWIGDTLHNFTDGLAIGASFLIGEKAGIFTSLAVGAHELPHEMADFSLYLKAGVSRRKTLFLNIFSSLATVAGAIIIFVWGQNIEGLAPKVLAGAAGMFLYVALADLVPELHEETKRKAIISQILFFFGGMVMMYMSMMILEH